MITILGQEIPKDYIELVLFGVGIVSSILGAIVGFFLRRSHIRYQVNRQVLINAAVEFRSAFIDEIVILQTKVIKQFPESNLTNKVIGNAIEKHRKAMVKFSVFLSQRKKEELQKAWDEYSYKDEWEYFQQEPFEDFTTEEPFPGYKTKDSSDEEEEFKMRKLALKRINKILKII